MLYFLSLLASFIAVYFGFRYYSLTAGLKRLSTELKMMEDSLGQPQTLKLSMPDKYLADYLISLNHYLAQVEQHVLYSQKRELRFQKQIENSREAYVLVNGQKAKVIGEICMDMIFVDLTDIENVRMNDEVVIVGSQKNIENGITKRITLRQVAKWAGTIQDDVLTKFSGIKKQ